MPLDDILLHSATPLKEVQQEYVEGEFVLATVREESFNCVIFLPTPGMSTRRGRTVTDPQLMYLPFYDPPPVGSGEPIGLRVGDRLGVVAPELNEAEGRPVDEEIIWMVESRPQPLGRPGDPVIGVYAVIRKVEDGA